MSNKENNVILQEPEKTLEPNDYINKEQRYIVVQDYKLPIPPGIDLNALPAKYIKILAMINATENFKVDVKPYFYNIMCNGCKFISESLERYKKQQKRKLSKDYEKLRRSYFMYKHSKGLCSEDFHQYALETIAQRLKEIEKELNTKKTKNTKSKEN